MEDFNPLDFSDYATIFLVLVIVGVILMLLYRAVTGELVVLLLLPLLSAVFLPILLIIEIIVRKCAEADSISGLNNKICGLPGSEMINRWNIKTLSIN